MKVSIPSLAVRSGQQIRRQQPNSPAKDVNSRRQAIASARSMSIGRRRKLDDDIQVLFPLAWLLDQHGEEDEAVGIYERICDAENLPPVNAMINLAIIYEDRGDISAAERCLRKVLDTNPNNQRALLFMKDVVASKDMYYDEEHDRNLAKRSALLDTPVTDFELSVRARNCLKKMKIRTLGDLLKISEAELLSYKNFGETSLVEIKSNARPEGASTRPGARGSLQRGAQGDLRRTPGQGTRSRPQQTGFGVGALRARAQGAAATWSPDDRRSGLAN